jgi:beta-mannosidase
MVFAGLKNWTLSGNDPHVPAVTRAAETGCPLNCVFDLIPAAVPGCVHNDLLNAGLITDPYYEMDSLKSAWVADAGGPIKPPSVWTPA